MTMSVKRSTTNTAATKQETNFKTDGANNADAAEFQKAFGDQKIGDVLNKVADKNWTDPTKKLRTTGNPSMDKDAFFKMMLAQMKNQDPTKPMESHEMAAQLAQFSSVEQLNNIHDVLGGMAKAQQPSQNYQSLALIGKTVSGDSAKLTRVAGDTNHDFNFEMIGEAAKVDITVRDMAGNVVKKFDMGSLKKGQNTLSWNGLADDGVSTRPGEYHFAVDAKNASGQKVYAKTSFEGRITGLNYTPEGPVLLVGKQTLKLSDIKKIEETPQEGQSGSPIGAFGPSASRMPSAMPSIPGLPPGMLPPGMTLPPGFSLTPPEGTASGMTSSANAPVAKQEEYIPPAEEAPPTKFANIEDVPMAQDLINRLQKETR
jgi:flagellar basal-body rod modification protein FlgD